MTELELLVDLHKNSERQGPGSERETLKALRFTNYVDETELKIADIGCGSGAPTLTLSKNLNAKIIAVDIFPEFLNELNEKSKKLGLSRKIETLESSMEELSFKNEEFDIIWSEGAIYSMGFEKGIKEWRAYLKKGGYLAVSEITWTSPTRPKELEEFWNNAYPEIDTASNKIKILENNSYTLVGYFILDQKSWIDNYYKPLEAKFEMFLERNNHSDLAKKVIEENRAEIEMYQKYKEFYSYGFYIAQKK